MKIFELLSQSAQQQLDQLDKDQPPGDNPDPSADQEDDSQGKFDANKVQSSLQDVATGAQDAAAQPDLPGGGEAMDPSLNNQNVKPLDTALLAQIKGLPFSTKYEFDDKSPLNPLNIASMSISDLHNLKNMVRFKIQQTTMTDRVGLYNNVDMRFYGDLLEMVNTVMKFKTSSTSAQLAADRPSAAWQNMGSPK